MFIAERALLLAATIAYTSQGTLGHTMGGTLSALCSGFSSQPRAQGLIVSAHNIMSASDGWYATDKIKIHAIIWYKQSTFVRKALSAF